MPLAFASASHGTVAFGFFNIETDMLLLRHLFFFADTFCKAVVDVFNRTETAFEGWSIQDQTKVGNLHGAIAGVDLSGFIGATYQAFPFPASEEGFKQNPDGHETQKRITTMIEPFAEPQTIETKWDEAKGHILVGEFAFLLPEFLELVSYVNRGGYPRWKNETRPDYVQTMMDKLPGKLTSEA